MNSVKLYANDRCIEEIFSANELREKAGCDKVNSKEEKKICNCPNCGAPIFSYICEYCGTKLAENGYEEEKIQQLSKKRQELVNKLARLELENSQHAQSAYLQSILNAYNIQDRLYFYQNQPFQSSYLYDRLRNQICCTKDQINAQIMNMRDSIDTSMAYQTCSLHDQMHNASMLTNVYPTGRIEHIPIDKDGNAEDTPISKADEELATALTWFMIGMVIFTLFVIGVTVIYNL